MAQPLKTHPFTDAISSTGSTGSTESTGSLNIRRKCYGKISCSISPTPQFRDRIPSRSQVGDGILVGSQARWIERSRQRALAKSQKRPGALDSSDEFQDTPKEIAGWGNVAKNHVFTKYGAEVVQEVLWIAKQKYDNQGVFLTGTVPLVTDIRSWVVMAYSGWIVNRLRQRLRDLFQSAYTVVHVWENTLKGKPHIHMAVISNDHGGLLSLVLNWHDYWFSILKDLTVETGVNLFERFTNGACKQSLMSWLPRGDATQADAQIIEKDVARYLSKYLSKAVRKESSASTYHPSRWWGVDNVTRREAKAERLG